MAEPKPPGFFKAIWTNRCSQSLEIPQSYVKHVKVETGQNVYLKGPSKVTWAVELVWRDGRVYFEEGWPEFFKCHSLGDKDILIFEYDGKVNFTVKIFDGNSFVKRQDLNGPEKSGIIEDAENPLQDHCKHEVSECVADEDRLSFVKSMKYYNVSGPFILTIPSRFITKHFSSCGDKLEIDLQNEEGKQWPVTLLVKKRAISAGWSHFVLANHIEEGDTCTFEFVHRLKMLVHISRQKDNSQLKQLKRRHSQQAVQVLGDEKKIVSPICSRPTKRLHLSEEQRVGDSDANDFPSFTIHMRGYSVRGFRIKRQFFSAYWPSYRKKENIVLQNEEGKEWSVNMCRQEHGGLLSAGWPLFVHDNRIKEKDTCTFKIVEQRKMLVHISRHCA